jgi:hypothetical protein
MLDSFGRKEIKKIDQKETLVHPSQYKFESKIPKEKFKGKKQRPHRLASGRRQSAPPLAAPVPFDLHAHPMEAWEEEPTPHGEKGISTEPVDGGAFTFEVLAHAGNWAGGAPVPEKFKPPCTAVSRSACWRLREERKSWGKGRGGPPSTVVGDGRRRRRAGRAGLGGLLRPPSGMYRAERERTGQRRKWGLGLPGSWPSGAF